MRLVTRADLDGLTCAVLLSCCEPIDAIELVDPQDVTDRRVTISLDDILANLPYHPGCGMWFDNHLLTDPRAMPPSGFHGRYGQAASAARLVYAHYSRAHPELSRYEPLLADTDRLDSAQLSLQDVVSPRGYILIGMTLDSRSGLGSVAEYFRLLLPAVRELPLVAVLELPEVRQRVERLRAEDQAFREAALACSRLEGNVIVTDFRPLASLPAGNRFLIFTLFPQANVAVRIQRSEDCKSVSVSAGHSIFDRSCRANLGVLLSLFGGGGHQRAAACVLSGESADGAIAQIVRAIQLNG